MDIRVAFGGGMELLFGSQRSRTVRLPTHYDAASLAQGDLGAALSSSTASRATDIRLLIAYLLERELQDKQRPDLFVQGQTVRPGILVLVNDCDWELEGELDYNIKPNDEIVFISTLHGG
ncbi:uncharacterized protein L969DRAFT_50369 [Mixia osmundae IAM 14324]|uniref:Ubiquitin-related modifier 1 n=1 Tax=Mixia osmundae (strain CBS 9802 / IAM 14324 / JCM 22182 / KY 12970) TaxID=764103 RepID=G7E712_MIXOS|nr:uncharacterized protein L969DRAFT_50369 [Mixia osmundae IAM 14324]KEI38996.1 hypothetical protein L969DRAFT_50369 [Mixia osmundae IAM 14324]GAA98622.1 hypothetical protein E5Q_05309 [Mixia osmundae IAM 14324]